jgi:D-inositol-3-phosphate glycosyltransferase
MAGGCAIYIGDNPMRQQTNPFGKDIANRGLFRAFAEHGPWDDQLFLVHNKIDDVKLASNLFDGGPAPKPVLSTSILNHRAISARGTLFRGQAKIGDLAWQRRQTNERAYSLVGLVHSLAPQAMRAYTAEAVTSPVEPWDALICTSPAVERHLRTLLEETSDYMTARFAGPDAQRQLPLPHLPVIPLGIDVAAFAARGEASRRREAREYFGVAEDAFALLWVGRLSFFEKAYPQAMFAAAEETARRTGRAVEFLMAGWFPDGDQGRGHWEAAATLYAPSVKVRFLDGNDSRVLERIWAASDVFVSLVDNIQETFGITPVEAMAAGLPVVVSDWDGYRATVRHGVTGFRIPTMMAPGGTGKQMAQRHALGMDSYQIYVAQVAAHVAVNVRAAADALTALATDTALAARMGAAAAVHARQTFDWPVVIAQYAALFEELGAIRQSASAYEADSATRANPVRNDPFGAFASFASTRLDGDILFRPAPPAAVTESLAHHHTALNNLTGIWRLPPEATDRIRALVTERGEISLMELVAAVGQVPHEFLARHLVWMCKVGLLDWATTEPVEIDVPDR